MISLLLVCALAVDESTYWSVDYLEPPQGEVLEVGGIGFMPDGAMVVSTRRGQIWRIEQPLASDPREARFTLICEGLVEGLGLAVVDGEILVLQRGELSRLVDSDGDHLIDEVVTVTQDWGMTGNYHEFAFGLPVADDGAMYVALNVGFWNPQWWHGKSRAEGRGWVLRIEPDGTVVPYAGGFRSPCGLGLLDDGTLLVTDNQGDWMPAGPIYAVEPGGFHGHPASLRWFDGSDGEEPSDTVAPAEEPVPAAIWLPYKWSRSAGNLVQDVDGSLGPFAGQYIVAELTNGQILRADFERIDGTLQGACWQLRGGIGSACRVAFAPDGTLIVGLTNRGWGGMPPAHGIARVRFTGVDPMEMQRVHLTDAGFDVTFTKPLSEVPIVTAHSYDYWWWWEYGSPEQHTMQVAVESAALSDDRTVLSLSIPDLRAGTVARIAMHDAVATDGTHLLHTEFNYTINRLPGGPLVPVAKRTTAPPARGDSVSGWLYLTWYDAFDVWLNSGVILADASIDPDDPTRLVTTPGSSALVAEAADSMTTMFSFEGDAEVSTRFMIPQQGSGVLWIGEEVGIRLANDELGPGSVVDRSGSVLWPPTANAFAGPGTWQELTVTYRQDRIDLIEIDGVSILADVPVPTERGSRQLSLRGDQGMFAFGDVRLRRLSDLDGDRTWTDLMRDTLAWRTVGDVEWHHDDGGTLIVKGNGTLLVPRPPGHSWTRCDTMIGADKHAGLVLDANDQGEGQVIDIATWGDSKTGGLRDLRPIYADLAGTGEWCTIEARWAADGEGASGAVQLNGIELLQGGRSPATLGSWIGIEVRDGAEVAIRRLATSP